MRCSLRKRHDVCVEVKHKFMLSELALHVPTPIEFLIVDHNALFIGSVRPSRCRFWPLIFGVW